MEINKEVLDELLKDYKGRFIYSLLRGLIQRSHTATGRLLQGSNQVAKRGHRCHRNHRAPERKVQAVCLKHPGRQRANRPIRKLAENVLTVAILHPLVDTQCLTE